MRIDVAEGPDEGTEEELGALAAEGHEQIERLAGAHARWGLGTADRWGLDQRTGLITRTFRTGRPSRPRRSWRAGARAGRAGCGPGPTRASCPS